MRIYQQEPGRGDSDSDRGVKEDRESGCGRGASTGILIVMGVGKAIMEKVVKILYSRSTQQRTFSIPTLAGFLICFENSPLVLNLKPLSGKKLFALASYELQLMPLFLYSLDRCIDSRNEYQSLSTFETFVSA